MGCDIHSFAEIRTADGWEWVEAFDLDCDRLDDPFEVFPDRDYGLFGFLADVRNYSHSPVLAKPRGLPADITAGVRDEYEEWGGGNHSDSWLSVAELLAYDYDQVFWDRRVTKGGNGAALADEGEGEHLSLREFLGPNYFRRLDMLAKLGNPADVRVVFWFDN